MSAAAASPRHYAPLRHVPLVAIEHMTMRFGGLTAVDDLSFEVRRGDITAAHLEREIEIGRAHV